METECISVNSDIPELSFYPHNFAELLQHLRLRQQLSTQQLAKIVHLPVQSIQAFETILRNPTLKTLTRYIQRLHLELVMTADGITIRDPKTNAIIIEKWTTNFR